MNREGQVFYRRDWHVVLIVVRSFQNVEREWSHELIALSDLEQMPGPNLVGHLYTWAEDSAARLSATSAWSRL